MLSTWYADYDAKVSRSVFSILQRAGFSELRQGHANSITGSFPLVASPTPMVTLVCSYLLIVLIGLSVIKLRGKRATKAADPLWLRSLVQV